MDKMNVLVNAYAVSPTWGSEPGVGWNWIINIAKECNVFVITEAEWEEDINNALVTLPQKDNIHFYFNPVSQNVRDMCWRQGDWRFYKYYQQWQKKTLEIAKDIISHNKIDIIHQLNMIGFREPGYLWQIEEIPFIWGPIGNMAPLPLSFLNGSPLKDKIKLGVKNMVSYYQARSGRVSKAIRKANQLISVLDSTSNIISRHYGMDNIIVVPETGLKVTPQVIHKYNSNRPLRLLWVGRFIPTKKLDIALKIIAGCESNNIELHIVGWGSMEEEKHYQKLSERLGIVSKCIWYGKIPNSQVQQLMRDSDIFLFTSVVEGTPHVVLEAISNNLPVMCFNLCGQGVIVNEAVGWKIPINSLSDATAEMIETLKFLAANPCLIQKKSENCEQRKPELSWEHKISQIIKVYKDVIDVK